MNRILVFSKIFAFILLFGLTQTYGQKGQSDSKKLRVCESFIGSIADFIKPPRLSFQKVEAYLIENESLLSENFSFEEFELLNEIYQYTGNWRPGFESFFRSIRSHPHFIQRLEWQKNIIHKAREGSLLISDLLDFKGLESALAEWKNLESKGWRIRIVKGRYALRVKPIRIDEWAKEISIRLAPSFHPLPLLLAAHIHFANRYYSLVDNKEKLKSLRQNLSSILKKNYLHFDIDGADLISERLRYLLAREVLLKTIEDYENFSKNYPYFKINRWESLKGGDLRETIDDILTQEMKDPAPTKEERERHIRNIFRGYHHPNKSELFRFKASQEFSFYRPLFLEAEELRSLRNLRP